MRINISLQSGSAVAVLMLCAGGAVAEPAHKTPKDCNTELYSRLAAIEAAGETPARFVHDCWYHSQPGTLTAIERPEPAPQEAERESEPAPSVGHALLRSRVAIARRAARVHAIAQARLADRQRRRLARLARAARVRLALTAAHVRLALTAAHERTAELYARKARHVVLLARNEPMHRREGREREIVARRARQIAERRVLSGVGVTTTVAALGPSARAGERMWVRVVAAGQVHIKPAVAIGDLAVSAGALNCWGQPVMFIGRGGDRWSRAMVCDAKPASTNEWSAQIYYGGPAR